MIEPGRQSRYVPSAKCPRRSLARLAPDAVLAADDRTISYIFSDESVGRDGHVIKNDGIRTDNFEANPTFLWNHSDIVVGKVTQIGPVGKQLRGSVRFMGPDLSPFADTVFRMTKAGYLSATSISWLPIKWSYSNDRARPGGIDFTEVDLLECSAVAVPALPTALATARDAGIDISPFAEWATRALDEGRSPIRKKELEMVRSLASAPTKTYSSADFAYIERAATGGARRGVALVRAAAEPRTAAWKSFGEYLNVVARSSAAHAKPDPRLTRAPSGLNELDPTAGGFLIPDNFTSELIGSVYEEALIAPLCDRRQTDHPENASLPAVDETSRVDGSRWGGVLSYWKAEGITPPSTLPKFKALKFMAHKLIALCIATEELIRDVPLLDGHLRRAFASEAAFQLDKTILLGNGVGIPWGVVAHPATISVAKQVGQASATIVAENIQNMWSRLPAPCRRRACWIVSEDVEQQLDTIAVGGALAGQGLYMPQGVGGNEHALLKGRPIFVAEQSPALGTPGDIVLGDWSNYVILDGGLQSALSLECEWLTFQGAFRFTLRVDGKPNLIAPITPYNGTSTRSPFVTLAQR
jgi:HK97 family phage major capsid protein